MTNFENSLRVAWYRHVNNSLLLLLFAGDVTLSEDYARSRHKLACPASQQDFCLHGGTCYQLKGLSNSIHCQ